VINLVKGALKRMFAPALRFFDLRFARVDARIAALEDRMEQRLGELDAALGSERLRLMIGQPLEQLEDATAAYLNWAMSHKGPIAQAGLWFNPPVGIEYRANSVSLGEINERLYELPFALGAAQRLEPGTTVIDVGSAESLLSAYLAALGLDVITVDPRPYPVLHPGIRSVTEPVERWSGPDRPVAAIFCISTVEHIGVGAYGQPASTAADLYRQVIERFVDWLAPGGELVLTAPFGVASTDRFQRVYDPDRLTALLPGWQLIERRFLIQTDTVTWEEYSDPASDTRWESGARGAVMLRALPPGADAQPRSA
jgi:hypothetical protein